MEFIVLKGSLTKKSVAVEPQANEIGLVSLKKDEMKGSSVEDEVPMVMVPLGAGARWSKDLG